MLVAGNVKSITAESANRAALGAGAIVMDVISTDDKREDYEKIPGGLPGIEARLALIHNFGVWPGKISLNSWVQICSTNPARIFGLYPQKGSLLPGADADIVVFDSNKRVNVTQTLFHEQVDYTHYEGFELMGYPVLTVFRGKVIAENGTFLGKRGDGRYLARKAQA